METKILASIVSRNFFWREYKFSCMLWPYTTPSSSLFFRLDNQSAFQLSSFQYFRKILIGSGSRLFPFRFLYPLHLTPEFIFVILKHPIYLPCLNLCPYFFMLRPLTKIDKFDYRSRSLISLFYMFHIIMLYKSLFIHH